MNNKLLRDITSDDVNQMVDPNNITITNDNPCILGSNSEWSSVTAIVKDGKTVFQNSKGEIYQSPAGTDYSGPINLIGVNLTVANGATVDQAQIIGGAQGLGGVSSPTVTIQDGGTLENSSLYNGFLSIDKGGKSSHDNYFSVAAANGGIKGVSNKDGFYATGKTDVQGTLNLSQYNNTSGNTGQKFLVGDSNVGMKVGSTGQVIDTLQSVDENSDFVKWIMEAGSYYGPSSRVNESFPDINNITVGNEYPCIIGNNSEWQNVTAIVKDGKTVFQSNSTQKIYESPTGTEYSGPIDLIGVNLTIADGATVDQAYLIGGAGVAHPKVVIENGGRLQNSQLYNGYLKVDEQGYSSHNEYYSVVSSTEESTHGDILGTVDHDSFYATSGKSITGKLNLKNYPNQTTFTVGDGYNAVQNDKTGVLRDTRLLNLGDSAYTLELTHGTHTRIPCFLAGTLIETSKGRIAVEALQIGDELVIYSKKSKIYKPIIWTGYKQITVNPRLADDLAAYPVRIVKGALGNNKPYKDMLITAEHCLCFNDQFIPVRMLVNGRSIYYDYSMTSYTYYHIECEEHAVICADGILTETYLNTGHRQAFSINDKVVALRYNQKEWAKDAALPLVTDRSIVEPLFVEYSNRAKRLGIESKVKKTRFSYDSAICLKTEQGEKFYPVEQEDKKNFIFHIPSYVETIYILSNTSRPCDTIGPFIDDRRNLGILIGNIVLLNKNNKAQMLHQHLQPSPLLGWHAWENSTCRWTKGKALLSLKGLAMEHKNILVLQVLSAGPYLLEERTIRKQAVNFVKEVG